MIITGLDETDADKEGVRRFLDGKAGTALSLYDIKTVIKLPPPRGKEDGKERVRIEIVENPHKKITIMKAKKILKQVKNMDK